MLKSQCHPTVLMEVQNKRYNVKLVNHGSVAPRVLEDVQRANVVPAVRGLNPGSVATPVIPEMHRQRNKGNLTVVLQNAPLIHARVSSKV